MASTRIDYTTMERSSAGPFYGPAAVYDGMDIVELKVLSDRRKDGGGIAWPAKTTPPCGKLIKIVAVALSDEYSRSRAAAAPRAASARRGRAATGSIPKVSRTPRCSA